MMTCRCPAGGTVAAYAAAGHACHIVTVFGSEVVEAMVGPLAAHKHARWQIAEPRRVSDIRRVEDAAAAKALGADMRWLGLPDAIYRGTRYRDDAALFGSVHPEEADLAAIIASEVLALPEWQAGTRVFVPLGIGDHVDHQIVFDAGCVLSDAGVEVFAYEDCPYAVHSPHRCDERLKAVAGAIGDLHFVDIAATLDPKLDAIACYASQLKVIFRFTDSYDTAIRQHATAVGSGKPAERFWRVWPASRSLSSRCPQGDDSS